MFCHSMIITKRHDYENSKSDVHLLQAFDQSISDLMGHGPRMKQPQLQLHVSCKTMIYSIITFNQEGWQQNSVMYVPKIPFMYINIYIRLIYNFLLHWDENIKNYQETIDCIYGKTKKKRIIERSCRRTTNTTVIKWLYHYMSLID